MAAVHVGRQPHGEARVLTGSPAGSERTGDQRRRPSLSENSTENAHRAAVVSFALQAGTLRGNMQLADPWKQFSELLVAYTNFD